MLLSELSDRQSAGSANEYLHPYISGCVLELVLWPLECLHMEQSGTKSVTLKWQKDKCVYTCEVGKSTGVKEEINLAGFDMVASVSTSFFCTWRFPVMLS